MMVKLKYNYEEITRALELHNADKESCDICPLKGVCDTNPFYSFLAEYALDLIKTLKQENEELKLILKNQNRKV